jgi:hypothetical protein
MFDRWDGGGEMRALRGLSLAGVFAVTLAAGTGVGVAPVHAGGGPGGGQPCRSFRPETASAARLAACGVASHRISSTTVLPDHGTMTRYQGAAVAILHPPPGFSPASASPAELARYGIPGEPPRSDLAGRALWRKMAARFSPVSAPSVLYSAPAVSEDSSNWGGYEAVSTIWGNAEEVPGTATLNKGGSAQVISVSCPSAGYCSAGGDYADGSGHSQAFVVDETKGVWGDAEEVPGTATLNTGGTAGVSSLSCPSAGYCSAGGSYVDGSGHTQAFVVDETKGVWGDAEEVPGTATLNTGGLADVSSLSCPSAGYCSAGGHYVDSSSLFQAFVVGETKGVWGDAEEVPGIATLSTGNDTLLSVSCSSAGDCGAGGWYGVASDGADEAFVVDETNGVWRDAAEVPGTATLNTGGAAGVSSLSCPSAGYCGAGGYYRDGSGHSQAFVVGETKGVWGDAEEVPGTAKLNAGGSAEVLSLSCPSAGNCSAAGHYEDGSSAWQAFVVGETNGVWGDAEEVPGIAALATGDDTLVSVSCSSAGDCGAGGWYGVASDGAEAFVVGETNGVWGDAEEVPGTTTPSSGQAEVLSVSCPSAGDCSAGGYYDSAGAYQAFVVSQVTQANYFHTAEAIYTEPYGYASSCGSGTSVAIWAGLGADSGDEGTQAWGQAGTQLGNWGDGLSANQAWIEVFNESGQTSIDDTPIYATPGSEFEVNVTRVSGKSYQWVFYFYNFATGKSLSVAATYSAPSGFTTAQYMIENQGELENFHTISFDDVSVAAQHSPITDFPDKEIQLYNSKYSAQLARTGPIANGGHSFSETWLRCT